VHDPRDADEFTREGRSHLPTSNGTREDDLWEGPSKTADDVLESTGAILVGRRRYEIEDRDHPGI
jgi:hypothetical protein